MATHARNRKPDFKIEIKNGRLMIETQLKGNWKLPVIVALLILLLLNVLAIPQPDKWLEILKAFLAFFGPGLELATDKNKH